MKRSQPDVADSVVRMSTPPVSVIGIPDDLPPESPPGGPVDGAVDTTEVRGPLQVEKLEGRQESGRDAQDEDEEDEEQIDKND